MINPCSCHSYNTGAGSTPEVTIDPTGLFSWTTKTVDVDACIADQIEGLWKLGIWTRGCCCSHNGTVGSFGENPSVFLDDPSDCEIAAGYLKENDPERDWIIITYASSHKPKKTSHDDWKFNDYTFGYMNPSSFTWFAWYPVRVQSGKLVWLRKIGCVKVFKKLSLEGADWSFYAYSDRREP